MATRVDPVSEQIESLRRKLGSLDKAELVELAVQLTATYVLEGLPTLTQATEAAQPAKGYDNVGDETFPGMLKRLKAQRPGDPVLEKFIINGEHIQVRTPMGNVDVTEYRRANAPAPAPATQPGAAAANAGQQAVPTPRDSIYNRELYGQAPARQGNAPAQRPAATAPAAASAPANAAANAPRPAAPTQPAAGQKDKADEKKAGERFRMIELD